MTNYKQTDPRWANYPYAGETMAAAGCGATAVADLLDRSPVEIADWLTANGAASNGSGTEHFGIYACLRAYGYASEKITSSSRAGMMNDPSFETFKECIQDGNCGILLMGGVYTGCRNSYWSNYGHYIAIVQYDPNTNKYLAYDPAYHARDGWHDWYDFQGNIKHVYTTNVRWKDGISKTTSSSSTKKSGDTVTTFKSTGTATCTEDSVNVRREPNGVIIGQVQKGNRFEIDGTSSSGWVHVKVSGIGVGYIYGAYVKNDEKVEKSSVSSTKTTTVNVKKAPVKAQTKTEIPKYSFKVKQVQLGDKGKDVLLLQEILKARGFYKGKLDSSFGNILLKSVKSYQKERKLSADGICGSKTWKDLLALPVQNGDFVLRQIKTGDTGIEVLLLQEVLKANGYYKGKLDRSFGNQTKEALKKYQTDRKGKAGQIDGIAGAKVWADMIGL